MKPDDVSIPPPQRWSSPFDEAMTESDVARIRGVEPFRSMNDAQFPPPLTLDGIIRNDMRLTHFEDGEVVVRAEDYGNSAFLVMRGEVRVLLGDSASRKLFRRDPPRKITLAQSIGQLWGNSRHRESRDTTRYARPSKPADRSATMALPAARIDVFTADNQRVATTRLQGLGTCRIGRGEDNDLVLKHATVSQHHAEIALRDGKFAIRDCDSLNGISVNGKRTHQQHLVPGDEIQIGIYRIRFAEGSRDAAVSAPRILEWPAQDDLPASLQTSILSDIGANPGAARTFLRDVGTVRGSGDYATLKQGEIFGEIAALGRTPRTATVIAHGPALLLEMRWQGLRDIRRRDERFRRHVEEIYRERSLATHLRATPLFAQLDSSALELIVEQTLFETYGEFDWHGSYKRFAAAPEAERLAREPLIVEQGSYPDGLLLVRSGFARVAQNYHHGLRTLRYIGQGSIFGLSEILSGWEGAATTPYENSLRAVGYTDVLRVPTKLIEEHVLPSLSAAQLERLRRAEPPALPDATRSTRSRASVPDSAGLPASLIEGLLDHHFVNGRAAMLINLERCVRCDACTEACAAGHNNNPRFNRHGRRLDTLLVANACMHCADPVCMIGCPTGAIQRVPESGEVVINDETCIGCATCANSCPYDNIRMVEIRDRRGRPIFDELSHAPIRKATKCDLCIDQLGGPACERACPHDALRRMDMGDLPKLARWLKQ